ncbi:Clavaminate synthase-like protein [Setomelanomma holmii]|uniref:Clavaminate synthase-like protein n=1 Tax=Setomelanomma holmii TaxID=210430 RepID=A0A9P4GWT6_9PLEO|nr:Clavaminate synthase-like protein [Setomelanomma holmii]
MSTAIAYQVSSTTSVHDKTFDVIDLTTVSSEEAYQKLSQAARTTGVALISSLPVRPPIAAIQRLFARLYADCSLASRLNATYPKRGVFKNACLAPDASLRIDQKTTIDLSISRLQSIRKVDPTVAEALGEEFEDIVRFYTYIETEVLPIVTRATSNISGLELEVTHNGTNNHLRLIDYFPCTEPSGPRCGEHRDYNTYTIVFQDGAVGGLEFEIEGTWKSVPASVDAVISWGWCGAILTNGSVKAAKHRVLRTWPVADQRTTAVIFVAPDLDTILKPTDGLGTENAGWCREIQEGHLTVGAFKEIISRKWRRREGTEPGEVVQGAQDREIEAFLKPSQNST